MVCGLQTPQRPCPVNPEQYPKEVLYYDGNLYPGWMKESEMKDSELVELLKKVKSGEMTEEEAARQIKKSEARARRDSSGASSGGCRY